MDGNVFLNGAKPGKAEPYPLILPEYDPEYVITEKDEAWYLELNLDEDWTNSQGRKLITSDILGYAEVPNLPFVMPDGKSYSIDLDFLNQKRNVQNPYPGPLVISKSGKQRIKVWPIEY